MEYMAAVEVSDLDALPHGTGKMRVPAAKYAVFSHEGHTSGIQALWENICSDWMPNAGVAMAETPTFERYGADFDAASNTGIVEIWIPIE
jgi:AraC family transcriptional regulator